MTKEQIKAVQILNLIDELSARNSYEDYRAAVKELTDQAIQQLGGQS